MPYNNIVSRNDASALIPEDVSKEVLKGVVNKSAALQLFRHRQMSRAQTRLPVVSVLPTAYFLTGASLDARDYGLKQTTEVNWTNKYLNAEELAVIVPIPKALIADADYDLWDESKPLLEEAIAVALDNAVFFGVGRPASWDTDVATAAAAAGNQVVAGTSTVDLFDDINNVVGAVEADGFVVNGYLARPQIKAKLRGMRDANRGFIYQAELGPGDANAGAIGTLFGEKMYISMSGLSGFATGAANYSLFCGDWNQGLIGIRQDIEFEMFKEGVIQDAANPAVIQYNLLQQDMVAMRVTARFAFAVPNPINRAQQTEASRYPFGVLKQKATTGGE